MLRNTKTGAIVYPNHDKMSHRTMSPLVCVYEMGSNEDLFRLTAREYELDDHDLAYACLSMAIDRIYGCGTQTIESRVRKWLEAGDYNEFDRGVDKQGLFAGLIVNMLYLADIVYNVLRKTINPSDYETMRADRVLIESGTLYLFISVVEALV